MSTPTSSPSNHISKTVEVIIESLGGLGDGIGMVGGKPVFVPKSVAGDRLRVAITQQTSEFSRGEIVDILAGGPLRIDAPCPHFSECGGCTLQMLEQETYKEFKTRIARNALKQAGFEGAEVEMAFLAPATRRRAEFKWLKQKSGYSLAYLGNRSHVKVAIDSCLILEPALQKLVPLLAPALAKLPFADDIASIHVTAADSGIGLEIALTFPHIEPVRDNILPPLAEQLNIASISVTDGRARILALTERAALTMRLLNTDISLPPATFLQATREGQKLLTEFAQKGAADGKHIVDLFCGIGTYSFPLASRAKVLAVENNLPMVHALREAARSRNMPGITAEKRDLFTTPLTTHELKPFDTAIINPPRAGAKAQTEMLALSTVKTVVMISCNPGTFARDAKILKNAGFALTNALAIDQFVYSPHLEIAAMFKRRLEFVAPKTTAPKKP